MSYQQAERVILGSLLGLGGISAIGGAIGLLTGGLEIETSELAGSPFSDFTIPALILGVIVGGSQLAALAGLVRGSSRANLGAGAAGGVMGGWIVGEVILIGSDPGIMRNLQLLYFLLGLGEVGLAALLARRSSDGQQHWQGAVQR